MSLMSKTLLLMGVVTMIIGIGFGVAELINPDVNDTFLASIVIWTVGAVATGLGFRMSEREGILQ